MSDPVLAGARWIPEDEYQRIISKVPIVCVDLLPIVDGREQFGLIKRYDAFGKVGYCLIGGALLIDEPLEDAVERHVLATLGPAVSLDRASLSMVGVYQYFRKPRAGALHDPRKNAISITYWGIIAGTPQPQNEALDFEIFQRAEIPDADAFGFGQGTVVLDALQAVPV